MSFAQEMKDFVGAWTTVNQMGVDKKKLDLQRQEIENLQKYREESMDLDREQLELSRANAGRNFALAAERNAIDRDVAEAQKAAAVLEGLDGAGGGSFDFTPVGQETAVQAPAAAPAQAIPAPADPTANFSEDFGQYDAMGQPVFRQGGLVTKAVEGGMMGESPAMPPEVDEMKRRQAAIPTEPNALPSRAMSAPPARPTNPDFAAARSVASDAQTAVADAAPALLADARTPEAAVGPGADTERMDIVNNRGGLSMDEYKELISTIDPNDSIPAYLKSAAVLASTHRYFIEQGQPAKAQRIAKGILILNKEMTQTLGALAQNAMQEGDVSTAAQLVTDAANQLPTADQFKVSVGENGLTYTRMKDGKEAESGQLTPEQLWELTGKVKNGSLFIQEMGRLAQSSGPEEIGPTQALELTSNAYVKAMQAQEALATATDGGVDPEELNALRDQARNAVATYNKFRKNTMQMGVKRTDIEAMNDEALSMAIPDAAQPEGVEGGTAGGNAVQFDNLPVVQNPSDAYNLPPEVQYFLNPAGTMFENPNYMRQ